MSNTSPLRKIKFEIEELENKSVVKMENVTEGMQSSKTIQLKAFIDYITEYNKDKVINDSGFLPPNLVRKINRGSREMCLYFFPQLQVSPSFYAHNAGNHRLLSTCLHLKDTCPVKIIATDGDYDDDEDGGGGDMFKFKDLIVNNIVLATTYDSNSHFMSYNVFHALKEDSIFDTSSGPYDSINNDTKLIHSIFPNHYETSICWGNINFTSGLTEDFKTNNYSALRNIPFNYLNSVFNNDLLGAGHGGGGDNDFRNLRSELKNKIIDFYYNNLSDSSNLSRRDFTSRFQDTVMNSDNRIASNVGSMMFATAPILTDSALYAEYFSSITNRNNTRTVKQYLEGNNSND